MVFGQSGLGGDLSPLGGLRGAVLLVGLPIDDVTFEIEMVVDVGMDTGELWHRFHLSKPQHGPLSWSERQVAFSTRLFAQRPTSCFTALPNAFIAAL